MVSSELDSFWVCYFGNIDAIEFTGEEDVDL